MIKRLLSKQASSIASAAVIVASFSVLSRFVGFIRDRILAGMFGAGVELDVYFAAFRFPDLVFQFVVVGAISASFIPLFLKYLSKNERRAWEFTNNMLNVTLLVFGVVVVVGILLSEPFAQLVAPGFTVKHQMMVAQLSRWMFVAQLLLAVSMIFGSVLQGMKRFVAYSLAPIFYNVGIIFGALVLVPTYGLVGLSWGVLIGAGLHLFIQLLGAVFGGYRYMPILRFNRDLRHVGVQMVPRVLSLSVHQLNFIAMTVIASSLAAGSLTILQFAYNLNFFPVGVIGVSFAIAVFPTLCELADKRTDFVQSFSSTVRQILLFAVPATVLFIALRAQIVRVVIGAGQFDWDATIATADTLGLFAVSLVAQSIIFVLMRAYFALDDTRTPFVIALLGAAANIVLAVWLSTELGVVGFGAAYSIASVLECALLWLVLRIRMKTLDEARIARSLGVMILAAALCVLAVQGVKFLIGTNIELSTFWSVLLQGLVAGVVGLAVYFAVAYALKSEETILFFAGLRRRFFKRARPQEAVVQDLSQ